MLIAAAACEMHPRRGPAGAGAALGRATRSRPRTASAVGGAGCASVPAIAVGDARRAPAAAASARRSDAHEGQPRLPADRHARRARARRCWPTPDRVDHVEVVEIDSGEVVLFWDLPAAQAPRGSRARCASDLGQLEADEFIAAWALRRRAEQLVTLASRSPTWPSRPR